RAMKISQLLNFNISSLEIANPHIDMKDLSSVLELYGSSITFVRVIKNMLNSFEKFSQLGIGALGLDL
ncbi:6121_t:CDS:2, partial [Gigaspora rosea]